MVDGPVVALTTKLGIVEQSTLVLLHRPPGFDLALPTTVKVRHRATGRADVVISFCTTLSTFERQLPAIGTMIFPSGALWVAWPKRSSGLPTDISDHELRDVALPKGLVDNKVCAIDSTWTALRFVWRRERRARAP